MATDPKVLYLQISQLVSEMPSLSGRGSLPPETYLWLGRATELVKVTGNLADSIGIASASDQLGGTLSQEAARRITAIVFRVLAYAEALAPDELRGAVLVAGASLSTAIVIKKVLGIANTDAMVIDPYMDAKFFTDFAPLAPENVSLRLLSDPFNHPKSWLDPMAARWANEYGTDRPLEVRTTTPRELHDRLLILDDKVVYSVTQSFNKLAERSPALVQRLDEDLAALKVEHYRQLWESSKVGS